MPKTATAFKVAKVKSYKLFSRWCSTCIATAPRKIVAQGEADETDQKFWKDCTYFNSVCPTCSHEVKDFFTPDEIKSMESVGILK